MPGYFSRKLPVQDGRGCRPERVADKAAGRVSGRVGSWRSRFVRYRIAQCHDRGSSLLPQWRPSECQATIRLTRFPISCGTRDDARRILVLKSPRPMGFVHRHPNGAGSCKRWPL